MLAVDKQYLIISAQIIIVLVRDVNKITYKIAKIISLAIVSLTFTHLKGVLKN